MNFKNVFFTFLILLLTDYSAAAQKSSTVSPKDFKYLIGCWRGTFNYSGTIIRKPYTTTADVFIRQIGKSNKFRLSNIYKQEPGDSSFDTIIISKNGRKLNGETIRSKRHTSKGYLKIITEVSGFDNDNNKAALFRNTYIISEPIYTYKKEVQLEGQTNWMEREEFKYVRKRCRAKNKRLVIHGY